MSPVGLDLSEFELKFIFPSFHISTTEAYAGITSKTPLIDLLNLISQPIDKWKGKVKNDFELSAFIKHPELRTIKERLYKDGAIYSSMTGSGSVIYGLFKK
jgi:4-diphosphocytidyl-2-C-methyl-D-erythritol kinase